MPGRNLYRYALEMLRTTNIYEYPVEDLHFVKDQKEHSLVAILAEKAKKAEKAVYNMPIQEKKKAVFTIISESLSEYAEAYPASFAVKQRIKKTFLQWLKEIKKKYAVAVTDEELKYDFPEISSDTAVALLQLLQNPGGVTKKDMEETLGISDRAIMKDLAKIDHSLGESEQSNENFYIGGQPVQAKIKAFRRPGERARRYQTVNTVHPIILQENVMQAGTLIQALARNYFDNESDISYTIGMDIWSQLSEYGRERIRTVFTYGDSQVEDFIRILDDEYPGMEMASYYTEREMLDESGMSNHEKLLTCMKAETRHCRLTLFCDGEKKCFDMVRIQMVNPGTGAEGVVLYRATGPGSEDFLFTEDQVLDVDLL